VVYKKSFKKIYGQDFFNELPEIEYSTTNHLQLVAKIELAPYPLDIVEVPLENLLSNNDFPVHFLSTKRLSVLYKQ